MTATALVATGLMAAAISLPASRGYVNDFAGVLDEQTKQDLTTQLRALEADTTAEVAIATVSTLDGESIEDYAVQLFAHWGVGQKTLNNGVLVLVSPGDRRVRIEVGYGLEPILPDGLTGDVIRHQFLPNFRHTDYAGALRAGVTRLSEIIRAKHVVTADERLRLAEAGRNRDWPLVLFIGLFTAAASWSIGLGVRAKAMNGIMFGLIIGGITYFLSFNIAPEWTHVILDPIAVVFAIVGFHLGKRRSWRSLVRTKSMSRGWVMDGGEGGSADPNSSSSAASSSSSSSSSSSDSFGGGSSGGGGASGSW